MRLPRIETAKIPTATTKATAPPAAETAALTTEATARSAKPSAAKQPRRASGKVSFCAGILRTGALLDYELSVFRDVLKVNLGGTFLGIKAIAPLIGDAGGGGIVLVSSVEGLQGSNAMAAYASSKWGVRGLAKVAAQELGARGIRVNSIHPGPVDTPMFNPQALPRDQLTGHSMFARMPIARAAGPDEIGALCAFLLGDNARFISGAEIAIDGGLTSGNPMGSPPSARQ